MPKVVLMSGENGETTQFQQTNQPSRARFDFFFNAKGFLLWLLQKFPPEWFVHVHLPLTSLMGLEPPQCPCDVMNTNSTLFLQPSVLIKTVHHANVNVFFNFWSSVNIFDKN